MWDAITHPCPNLNGLKFIARAWMSNYIPQCYVDEITYPFDRLNRVSSGQGKVREIPDLAKVGKNEYWEKSGNLHLVQSN